MSSKLKLNAAASFCIVLLLFLWSGLSGFYQFRFNYSPLNYYAVALLCLALPVTAFQAAFTFRHVAIKTIGVITALLLFLPMALVSLLAFLEGSDVAKQGTDYSYELLQELKTEQLSYRLYRTNCGATCSYGLELRKEIDTPIGIKWVMPVWSRQKAEDAVLTAQDNTVQIIYNGDVTVIR